MFNIKNVEKKCYLLKKQRLDLGDLAEWGLGY